MAMAMSLKMPKRHKKEKNLMHVAIIGRNTTAIMRGIDKRKHKESVEAELESELTSEKITCTVRRSDPNTCDIIYKPTLLGRHRLHIAVDGKPVKGSPFPVTVSSPTSHTFSTPVKSVADVRGPWGMALDRNGDIIMVETKALRVSTYSSSSGEKLQQFEAVVDVNKHHGDEVELKLSPRGVTLDSDGNVLITDFEQHCIHKFTSSGEHVTTVGKEGDKPLEFRNPSGICFHTLNNKIYVTEYGNHCVQILNSDLTYFNSFGCRGKGRGQLNHPFDVAFDSTGNVYITDQDNHRIQVFTADGQFLHHFGQWGTGSGDLQNPYGIAIDTAADDTIYVTEGSNYRVSKFKRNGKFIGQVGVEKKRLFMNALCGVAIGSGSNSGVVYVSDYVNNCILFFNKDFDTHEVNDS